MTLKNLTPEIEDLAYWLNDYAETISDEEARIKMADIAHYLIILRRLIVEGEPDILRKIQI